jgi:hypothetical protein
MSSTSKSKSLDLRPRRRLRVRWVLLVAALAWHCGPVARRGETLTVTGDLAYNEAIDTDYGCEGEVTGRQVHRSLGAAAALRYETAGGGLFGARFRGMAAEVIRAYVGAYEDKPAQDIKGGLGYGLLALGFDGGWDWKHAGFSLGLTAVIDANLRQAMAVPFAQLRLGDLSSLWLETSIGSDDPLFFYNVASIGAGLRLPQGFRARAGLTLHGKVIRDVLETYDGDERDRLQLALQSESGLDTGGHFELRYLPPTGGLGVELGVLAASEPAVRLGLSYTIPVE